MHITVFGATGAIGSLTVAELLNGSDTVTAYVRNPDKIPASWGDRVRVTVGEMSDAAAIDTAVTGADAVVSALGPSMDRSTTGLPLVEGTKHVLEAMKRHGVSRYVGHGTPSIRDPREKATTQTRLIGFIARTFLRRAYDEMLGMSALIMDSGLDWTIVRFTAPNDKPRTGKLRVGFYGQNRIGFPASRADIAAFTAAQVRDIEFIGAAPAISN